MGDFSNSDIGIMVELESNKTIYVLPDIKLKDLLGKRPGYRTYEYLHLYLKKSTSRILILGITNISLEGDLKIDVDGLTSTKSFCFSRLTSTVTRVSLRTRILMAEYDEQTYRLSLRTISGAGDEHFGIVAIVVPLDINITNMNY